MIKDNKKLGSDDVAEFDRYFSPKGYVVEKLPNEKTVRDFTEVYQKNDTGGYDTYRMVKGKWVLTNSNLNTKEVVVVSGSGGSATAGVDSFNGRTGKVVPASGDYDNADVGLGNVDDIQQMPLAYLDIDDTLAADSDTKVPSQQATKAYADNKINYIVKQTDQTKNSDITLANDSELVIALAANSKYLVDILVGFYFDATPGIKIQLAFSGTLTSWLANSIICEHDGTAVFTNSFNDATLTTTQVITSVSNTNGILRIKGIIEVGASAGNLSVQFAQNVSDAGNTTVKKGSFIKTNKI